MELFDFGTFLFVVFVGAFDGGCVFGTHVSIDLVVSIAGDAGLCVVHFLAGIVPLVSRVVVFVVVVDHIGASCSGVIVGRNVGCFGCFSYVIL